MNGKAAFSGNNIAGTLTASVLVVALRRSLLLVGLTAVFGCAMAACVGGGEGDLNPQPLPPSAPPDDGKNATTGANTGAPDQGAKGGGDDVDVPGSGSSSSSTSSGSSSGNGTSSSGGTSGTSGTTADGGADQ